MTLATTGTRPPGADLSFQAHFDTPPAPPTIHPPAPSAPSLVVQGITHEDTSRKYCPNGRWVQALCDEHHYERWIYRPCKSRRCPVCGVRRRKKVAWRIANGVEMLAGEEGAAWFVGTWNKDVSKSTAVKAVSRFVAWLRRHQPSHVEYACTWELTKRNRLHVNLILAPWKFMSQRTLSTSWSRLGGGQVVWIKRVGEGIGQEAAKSRATVGRYFSKWEQMVRSGRAATYSKGWPKLPDTDAPVRHGHITYIPERDFPTWVHSPALDPADIQLHLWTETHDHEYKSRLEPYCDCFNYVLPFPDYLTHEPPDT